LSERLCGSGAFVVTLARACAGAERDMGLLVIGSRGDGPLQGLPLGSVAAGLLRTAPCSVIVCPRGDEEGACLARRDRSLATGAIGGTSEHDER
jgi:Universal stress protein family